MFHNQVKNVKSPVRNVLSNADYKPSNLIGRVTFQSLEQLLIHDVTRPPLCARVLGSGARD